MAEKKPTEDEQAEAQATEEDAKAEEKAPEEDAKAEAKAPKKDAKGEGKATKKDAKGGGKADKKGDKGKKGKAPAVKAVLRGEPRLKKVYREQVVPGLIKKFEYANVMEVPRLEKIVLNMGIGEASRDIKLLDAAEQEMTLIAGQKPVATRAKRAIAAFKIREDMPVGCFVTLRGRRMYDFLERLINIAIPRVRDFRGLPTKSFDGRGNHSMGIREHLIFTELEYDKVSTIRGMNITTVTTAKTDEEAREMLRLFGMPFREQ